VKLLKHIIIQFDTESSKCISGRTLFVGRSMLIMSKAVHYEVQTGPRLSKAAISIVLSGDGSGITHKFCSSWLIRSL
jgi:hypothetical protein